MNKSTLPQGVRKLKTWAENTKGTTLRFDHPVQRASGQWSALQRSLLIHSILGEFPIPPLYLIKCKSGDDTVYQVLDGKQRCTNVFEFINGDFALHASTPPLNMDGDLYEIANKRFEDLSEELRDVILGFRFTIYVIEDATDEEVEEAFARLNASTSLTLIQKSRPEMKTELARWTKEMTRYPFFTQAVSLTLSQARRESELEVLLQSMLLLDARDEGYPYRAISMKEVVKYCRFIRGDYSEQKKGVIRLVIEYLSEAFTEKHKFLKKSNVPMVFVMAEMAIGQGVSAEEFKSFIDYFSENTSPEYVENTGSGNITRAKTEGRLLAIYVSMKEFFGIPDSAIGYPVYLEEVEEEESEDA